MLTNAFNFTLMQLPKMSEEDFEEFMDIYDEDSFTEALMFAQDKGYINNDMFVILKYGTLLFDTEDNYYEDNIPKVRKVIDAFHN